MLIIIFFFADEIYVKWRKLRYRHLQLSDAKLNMIKSLHKQYQLALITNGPSTSQWEKVLLKLLNKSHKELISNHVDDENLCDKYPNKLCINKLYDCVPCSYNFNC